jgi:DNA-binding CsgD family transcriptional regulator
VHRWARNPLVARSAELAVIAEMAERALSHAAFVLLRAPAGFGKSALLDEAVDRLGDRRVVRLNADSFESDLAFATAEAVARSIGARWPEPHAGASPDPLDVGRALLDAFDALEEPLCVVVDDAQWVDVASSRAFRFVMRRLHSQRLLVILATRPEPTPLTTAVPLLSESRPLASRIISLAPFTAEDTQELATAVLGRPVSRRSAARLTDACGGSPLVVSSAIRNARTDGALSAHPGVDDLVVPEDASLPRQIADALASASSAARDATAVIAVLRDPTAALRVRAIAARAGREVDIDAAVALGLTRIRERDGVTLVEPEHALVADGVVAALPHAERLALHAAAAAEFGGHRALRHRVEAADAADTTLTDDLVAAAQAAADRGDPDDAMELALRALHVAGSGTADEERLLVPVGIIAIRTRRHERVLSLVPAFERLPPSLTRDLVLVELYTLTGRMSEAMTRGTAVLADTTASADARAIRAVVAEDIARIHLATQDFALVVPQTQETLRLLADAPTDPAELDDPALGWFVAPTEIELRTLSWRIAGAGRTGDVPTILATIDDLESLFRRGPDVPATIDGLVTRARVFLGMGQVERALADLARTEELLRRFSTSWTGGIGRAIYAHILFLTGEWDASVAMADAAVALALDETNLSGWPIALAVSALVRAGRGESAATAERLRAAADASARWGFSAYDIEIPDVAAAESARARGDRAAQLAATDALSASPPTGSAHAWASHRIDALSALGRHAEARSLLAFCRDPRSGWRPSSGPLDWLIGRVEEAEGDAGAAILSYRRAVDDPANARFPFPLAVARLDLARLLSAAGRSPEATSELAAAIVVFRKLGAAPFLRQAVAALQAQEHGARTVGGPQVDPLGSLTTRERQVAHALSTGLTNREIAEQMYVSVTTVNFHVRNVLAKLGLSSRRELRALVGAS